jgi:predicted dehydrogenase
VATRIGLAGIDSSHADDFLRIFNADRAFGDSTVTAFWSHDGDASRVAELSARHPEAAAQRSLAHLVVGVDAVIVGCRDGGLHLHHAIAAIEAGKPVFVDKPLANTFADGRAIVDAAARAWVPICSASALRWQEDTHLIKARLAYLVPPLSVEATGTWYRENDHGGPIFYAIHTIELVQELLGIDWRNVTRTGESSVSCTVGEAGVTMRFTAPQADHSHFAVTIRSAEADFTRRVVLPDDYMIPVAARIVRMIETGASPLDRAPLLAPLALMEAIEQVLA